MTAIAVCIDLMLVAVFGLIVYRFLKFGFAATVLKIGKTWLSVICSLLLGPWVAALLQKLFLRNLITNGVERAIGNFVQNNPNGYNLQQLFENLPESFTKLIGTYGVSFAELEREFGSATNATPDLIRTISERLAAPCIDTVSSIIGHIVSFIVPLIVFAWLSRKIRRCRIPFFRAVDRISGFLVGVIAGYASVVLISVVLYTIFQVIVTFNMNSPVVAVYEKSIIFQFLSKFDTIGTIKGVIAGMVK